ncbi:hypothetical protein AB0J21_19130 [Streptomyces sp. NPDC049954]|uniref:hypothetical protein n=1 Tax=Streptomyces sp. NPDC049954 TaxID=3155779 RepID=UPI00342AA226
MPDRPSRPTLRLPQPAGAVAGGPLGTLPTAVPVSTVAVSALSFSPLSFAFPGPALRGGNEDGSGGDAGTSDKSGKSGGGGASGREGSQEDNPFAPPPEDRPDQPWQPRRPQGGEGGEGGGYQPWGGQWSGNQPGPSQGGGFGDRPGRGPEGPQNPQGGPPRRQFGPRWDPTDPVQRRARYALMAGIWGLFSGVLLGWTYLALLLGALGLYWGIAALRGTARTPEETEAALRAAAGGGNPEEAARAARGSADSPSGGRATATAFRPATAPPGAVPQGAPQRTRPQVPSAVGGIVTSSLTLAAVVLVFVGQLVYRDYFTCVDDALTNESKQSCDRHLPEELRPLLGE